MASGDEKQGLQTRRQILGDAWVDRTLQNRNPFNEDFQNFITRYVWGEIWTRPGIDHRTRRYMVLSTMMALGRWEEFRLHVRAALEHGFSPDDIKEIVLQGAIYCGVPAGNHAMHEAQTVMAALEAEAAHPST
jgi:4-carboxymuconolactone decarboxylase